MALADESCVECRTGEGKLSPSEVANLLEQVNGWDIDGGSLAKQWKFKNFIRAQAFVNKVGEMAEEEGHHPDIGYGWGYANVRLTTHSAAGLTRNDFVLAAKIDGIE